MTVWNRLNPYGSVVLFLCCAIPGIGYFTPRLTRLVTLLLVTTCIVRVTMVGLMLHSRMDSGDLLVLNAYTVSALGPCLISVCDAITLSIHSLVLHLWYSS